MKKLLVKASAILTAVLTFFLGVPTAVNGFAESETFPLVQEIETQTSEVQEETLSQTSESQQGVLRVGRCDFTSIVGDRAFYLPKYKAISADGSDITSLVTITDSKESLICSERGIIILKEIGDHVITYSVVDPATEETLTRSFTVSKRRELFNYYNLTGERYERAVPEEQYCVSLNPGQGISRFNMPVSKTYYAEVYFNATQATQFKAGLAHVVRTNFDKGVNSNLWWASMVDIENGMSHTVYKDTDWSLQAIKDTTTQTTLVAGEGFTYAVARYETTLYAFINGVLVSTVDVAELANIYTAPGIFTVATQDGDFVLNGGVKISNINYYDGREAIKKLSVLTGKKFINDIKVDVSIWGDYDTPLAK